MHFTSAEEVITNEFFLAWFYRNDEQKAREWEHFLLDHPDYLPLVEESITWLKEHDLEEMELPAEKVDAAFQRLQACLESTPVVALRPKRSRWWIPAAAAILILVIGGMLYWKSLPSHTKLDSQFGKISTYRLPDGSQVILNANSSVQINKQWKQGADREVWLDGEAFF